MKDTAAKQGVISITEIDHNRLSKLIGAMRASGSDQSQEYLERLARNSTGPKSSHRGLFHPM